jgi:hypothetical protein
MYEGFPLWLILEGKLSRVFRGAAKGTMDVIGCPSHVVLHHHAASLAVNRRRVGGNIVAACCDPSAGLSCASSIRRFERWSGSTRRARASHPAAALNVSGMPGKLVILMNRLLKNPILQFAR